MSFAWKKCTHEKLSAGAKSTYCQNCGEYVENHWYIARCKCCGIRHKTVIQNGYPVPIKKYCKNCGCDEYVVEEIDSPDIVTINYVALRKVSGKLNIQSLVQSWIENKVQQNYGYLPIY